MGTAFDTRGAPNAHGVSDEAIARWWHAVYLIITGRWRARMKTRRFTTDAEVAGAVAYAARGCATFTEASGQTAVAL